MTTSKLRFHSKILNVPFHIITTFQNDDRRLEGEGDGEGVRGDSDTEIRLLFNAKE